MESMMYGFEPPFSNPKKDILISKSVMISLKYLFICFGSDRIESNEEQYIYLIGNVSMVIAYQHLKFNL